tara:strand:- start:13 stop:336 length:324 start_codon:yes stop_codon:yes gene_type:complete
MIKGDNMSTLKEKTFVMSANLRDLKWARKASTLPESCRVRTKVAVPGQHDTIPPDLLHEAIYKDVQKRYNVPALEYNVFDLKIEIEQQQVLLKNCTESVEVNELDDP